MDTQNGSILTVWEGVPDVKIRFLTDWHFGTIGA
jgi:hypothetical protein